MANRLKSTIKEYVRVLSGNAPAVDLVYWSAGDNENFGDYLSRIVVSKLLERGGADLGNKLPARRFNKRPPRLLAIGSIMHMAKEGDVIWGTGINGKVPLRNHRFVNLDVRMVRGPYTRQILLDHGCSCPEVYGDPALLLPLLVSDIASDSKKRKLTVIPNLNDMWMFGDHSDVVSPLEDWRTVVASIIQSELVVTSSLHGLVVADAYGVPARLLLSNHEPMLKYRDYLASTNRSDVQYARSIDEAVQLGGMSPPEINMQEMIRAFPVDLWNGEIDQERLSHMAAK